MLVGWEEWTLARILMLIFGVAYIMLWFQITIWHARGKFHKWQMWIPVYALPLLGVVSILLSIFPVDWLGFIQTVFAIIGISAGLYGGYLHIVAIKHRTGGLNLENLMAGPPFVLPFTIAAFGMIQLLLVWY
jgi:hypothetical protein